MKKDLKIPFGGHYILYGKSDHDGGVNIISMVMATIMMSPALSAAVSSGWTRGVTKSALAVQSVLLWTGWLINYWKRFAR